MIAKVAELVQGDKFTHEGQLYRVVVNIKEKEGQRKLFVYHTDGKPRDGDHPAARRRTPHRPQAPQRNVTVSTVKRPSTVRGQWIAKYETLTDDQKQIFNYRYEIMGQPAALAYRYATEGY